MKPTVPHRHTQATLALASALALAACGSVDLRPEPQLAFADVAIDEYPALRATPDARVRLSRPDEPAWNSGDKLVYGIRVDEGGTTEHLLLELFAIGEPGERKPVDLGGITVRVHGEPVQLESTSAVLSVTVGGDDGKDEDLTVRQVFCDLMTRGIYRGIEASQRAEGAMPDREQSMASAEGFVGLLWLFRVISNDKTLGALVQRLADRPSVWSVVTSFGVTLDLDIDFLGAERVRVPVGDATLDAFRLPLTIRANGTPALHCWFTVVEPRAPLGIGAGIVALDAYRPSDRTARLSMRLLVARPGR